MSQTTVHSEEELNKVLDDNTYVVIDFFAKWCGPCKMISPYIEKLEKEYQYITFVRVDVDEVSALSKHYKIEAMPTFVYFKNKKEISRVQGANPKEIKNQCENLMNTLNDEVKEN